KMNNGTHMARLYQSALAYWAMRNQGVAVTLEMPLASTQMRYGGAADAVLQAFDETWILEFKYTTDSGNEEAGEPTLPYAWQLMAYGYAYEEKFGIFPRLGLVTIGKVGFKVWELVP